MVQHRSDFLARIKHFCGGSARIKKTIMNTKATPTCKLITDFDTNLLHWHGVNTKGKHKVVDLSFNRDSLSWDNRLALQLCTDENPLVAKWNVSPPREEDEDKTKYMLDIQCDDVLLEKLEQLDHFILDYAFNHSREMFKKDLKEDQIRDKYTPLVKRKDGIPSVHVKVRSSDADRPAEICKIDPTWTHYTTGSLEDLTKGSKVVPIVRTMGLWVSENFGMSLQVDKILVQTMEKVSFMDSFHLSE